MSDILLTQDTNKIWDIAFDDDGDFVMTEGLETAIFMSILCERRADESEVTKPEFRRGDWSNELNEVDGYEVGSKFWLLDSARANEESVNAGVDSIEEGLQWMIDDLLIKTVEASGVVTFRGITFTVLVTKQDNNIETFMFEAFEQTG